MRVRIGKIDPLQFQRGLKRRPFSCKEGVWHSISLFLGIGQSKKKIGQKANEHFERANRASVKAIVEAPKFHFKLCFETSKLVSTQNLSKAAFALSRLYFKCPFSKPLLNWVSLPLLRDGNMCVALRPSTIGRCGR